MLSGTAASRGHQHAVSVMASVPEAVVRLELRLWLLLLLLLVMVRRHGGVQRRRSASTAYGV